MFQCCECQEPRGYVFHTCTVHRLRSRSFAFACNILRYQGCSKQNLIGQVIETTPIFRCGHVTIGTYLHIFSACAKVGISYVELFQS